MNIFEIKNSTAQPTMEILLITPFKEIWDRDLHTHKGMAIKEFTYIEFMCSPKKTNPFWGYIELKERSDKIIERIFPNKEWQPDNLIAEAINIYREFLKKASPSLNYLDSAMQGIIKVQDFFKTVDLNKTNSKGALLYKPRDITTALSDTEKVIKNLDNLREKVVQELLDAGKTMNNRKISEFEE